MDYHCQHCGVDLDAGDVYQVIMEKFCYTPDQALIAARAYGWSETNKIHFLKSIIVQPDREPQYEECPSCKGKWPIKQPDPPEASQNGKDQGQ